MNSAMNIIIFSTIFIVGIFCENAEFESKRLSDPYIQKRGAVGGIVYASKQNDYATAAPAQSPARTLAKPSPNSSNNNLYNNIAPQQQTQQFYTLPKQLFSTQPQTFNLQQQQHLQPQFAYALQPQAYKIGYAQQFGAVGPAPTVYASAPAHHQVQYFNVAPGQLATFDVHQPFVYQQPQQLVKVGYAQPVAQPAAYAKVAAAPAPATAVYTAAPAQHVQYAAPTTLTKIGYATPSIAAHHQQQVVPAAVAAPATLAQANHVVAATYSPASLVSHFNYNSPHVSYGSNGILTQTSYKTASAPIVQHQQQQQLAYSASTQPAAVYAVAAVPAHTYFGGHGNYGATQLTKIGYATPALQYQTAH